MPIIAALDPGSVHLALIVADCSDAGARLLFAGTAPLGRLVDLAVPIERVGRNGKPYTQRRERIPPTEAERDSTLDLVARTVKEHAAEVLLIEHVEHVHFRDGAGDGEKRAQATELTRSSGIAGEIAGIVRGVHRIPIERVRARTWRAALLRHLKAHPLAPGPGVPPTPPTQSATLGGHLLPLIRRSLDPYPRDPTDHEIAACGLLLSRSLDCPASKAARRGKPRAPRSKAGASTPCAVCGVTWEAHAMAQEAGHLFASRLPSPKAADIATKRAIRLAAGCACRRPHGRTCPLYVPRYTRRGAPIGLDPLDALLGLTAE